MLPQFLISLSIAARNSLLKNPYIKGLTAELPYPVQSITLYNKSGVFNSRRAVAGIQMKKGNQQIINAPTTIPSVLAAPDSLSLN